MPEGHRDGATEAWLTADGWSVVLLTPAGDFISHPVTAVRVVAPWAERPSLVDDVQVAAEAGTEVLDADSHGATARFNLG